MPIFRTVVVAFGFLLIALVVYFNSSSLKEKFVADGFCVVERHACRFTAQENNVSVAISPAPIKVETELLIELNNSSLIQDVSNAYIEGVSMYMGKIPVLFELNNDNDWHATTMLGMCSEPNMQWRLVLEVTLSGSDKYEKIVFQFNSSR